MSTTSQTRTRLRPRYARRVHIVPAPLPRPEPAHRDERRMRAAGGPDDRADYACGCGYLFEAAVTMSVSCPHCGTDQAW